VILVIDVTLKNGSTLQVKIWDFSLLMLFYSYLPWFDGLTFSKGLSSEDICVAQQWFRIISLDFHNSALLTLANMKMVGSGCGILCGHSWCGAPFPSDRERAPRLNDFGVGLCVGWMMNEWWINDGSMMGRVHASSQVLSKMPVAKCSWTSTLVKCARQTGRNWMTTKRVVSWQCSGYAIALYTLVVLWSVMN